MYKRPMHRVNSYLQNFEMSKLAIFSLLMAFALSLSATLAAGEKYLDKESCENYLQTELQSTCDDRYKYSIVLSRRKRSFSTTFKVLAKCCIERCTRAMFISHCDDYTYDADKDFYIAQIAVSIQHWQGI